METLEPKSKAKQFVVKITPEEKALMQQKADQFAQGNLSKWLRYAGLNHVPKEGEK